MDNEAEAWKLYREATVKAKETYRVAKLKAWITYLKTRLVRG